MENSMNDMQRVLDAQKKHFIDEGSPSIELRVDRLNRLKSLIIDNRYDFVDALNEDYGNRSKNTSIMTDAYSIVPDINNAIKKQMDKNNGQSWNVVVGKNFGSDIGFYEKNMIYFYVGSTAILLWKAG